MLWCCTLTAISELWPEYVRSADARYPGRSSRLGFKHGFGGKSRWRVRLQTAVLGFWTFGPLRTLYRFLTTPPTAKTPVTGKDGSGQRVRLLWFPVAPIQRSWVLWPFTEGWEAVGCFLFCFVFLLLLFFLLSLQGHKIQFNMWCISLSTYSCSCYENSCEKAVSHIETQYYSSVLMHFPP